MALSTASKTFYRLIFATVWLLDIKDVKVFLELKSTLLMEAENLSNLEAVAAIEGFVPAAQKYT